MRVIDREGKKWAVQRAVAASTATKRMQVLKEGGTQNT